MAGIVDETNKFSRILVKVSVFEPINLKCDFSDSNGPSIDKKARFFVETWFLVLVRVKSIRLHNAHFPSKLLKRYKFFKGKFPKNNSRCSIMWQKVGAKRQSEIWNQIVPNRTPISSLDWCRKKATSAQMIFCCSVTKPLRSITWYRISERLSHHLGRLKYLDTGNTYHNTNIRTSCAALSIHEAILPRALHSEM